MTEYDKIQGVKTYEELRKNANSVGDYHILSNLTAEQEKNKLAYDGVSPDAGVKKTTNQENLDLSERAKRRATLQEIRKQERPMNMRSELVQNYFNDVMKGTKTDQNDLYKMMYKNVMDNRIFNNLKQQLNEMIDDEKSLISIDEFRKLFFTYFKGEQKATNLYDRLLPFLTVWNIGDHVFNDPSEITSTNQLIEAEKMVSVRKFSQFIDSFNFYPVKVDQIHFKNDSNEMTYIMTSNAKGSLAESGTQALWQQKSEEEKRLLKLLSLVSFKINERFRNLREAFRYIDTDHSQSISINEFSQAIDFFRLKISFEDVQKLYRYMDTDGDGEIGYEEFTLLSEERWRNIDPYKHYMEGLNGRQNFLNKSSERGDSAGLRTMN